VFFVLSIQPHVLLDYTGFDIAKIKECAEGMAEKVGGDDTVASNRRHLVAVKRKYDTRKYQHISTEFENPEVEHLLS
jgi:hypothetical protein